MTLIRIKALSINKAFQGRRFRTRDYDDYEQDLSYLLPKLKIPEGKLKLKIIFGFSNKGQDIDSSIKPTLDIFQKKFDFNDNRIYKLEVEKAITKKGEEYIDFEITKIMENENYEHTNKRTK